MSIPHAKLPQWQFPLLETVDYAHVAQRWLKIRFHLYRTATRYPCRDSITVKDNDIMRSSDQDKFEE